MKTPTNYWSFNRGLVSPLALARIDIKRVGMSAELMTNWMPRALGSMSLRPGTRYMHATRDNDPCVLIPFIYSTDDTAILELTPTRMRVSRGSDSIWLARPTVTTVLTNGGFTSDLSGWTDADEAGAASVWDNSLGFGTMLLTGTGNAEARRRQEVTVSGGNAGVEHSLLFYVNRGEGTLRVGSSAGASDYANISLRRGWYSIAFTPTGNFHIEFASIVNRPTQIFSVSIGAGAVFEILTPWTDDELQGLTWDQSGDVVFVASKSRVQYRIERYATRSWAIVEYRPNDGPFRAINRSAVTLAPGALQGTTTLTASRAFWLQSHVGAIFRVESSGQRVAASITAADQWSGEIRITGVEDTRKFTVERSGTWSATITLQRSLGAPGAWTDVATYTSNGSVEFDDGLDNQIAYYRIGVKTGNFTSGTAEVSLTYSSGSIRGVCRVVSITSATVAQVDVLTPFGGTEPTRVWWEGVWSDRRGYPSAVCFYDGRLWWAGNDRIYGSISDAFDSFDDEQEGDSGPISRSLGSGPVDSINWLLPLGQLIVGTQGSEMVAKSSNIEEPLTPTAFRLAPVSTQGSRARVPAARVDTSGIFVQRCGSRVYEVLPDNGGFTYASRELTSIVPEIGQPGIRRVAIARQPDTRVYCVRDDGKCAVLVFDPVEEVNCWVLLETQGRFEDVAVLPGPIEDQVYFVVNRLDNWPGNRFVEVLAPDYLSRGEFVSYLSDCSFNYEGPPTGAITGGAHLANRQVDVWGDGRYIGRFTMSAGGVVTLPPDVLVSFAVIGLPYEARFRSTKLGHTLQDGRTSLTQRQRIRQVGLVLGNTHVRGLEIGQDFDHLEPLPVVEKAGIVGDLVPPDLAFEHSRDTAFVPGLGAIWAPIGGDPAVDAIWRAYEMDSIPVSGGWDTDARLCLKAQSPLPCTVLAAIVVHDTNFKG